jgi:wyosine [tRNA(Phe)-imidazoG37] synthetase (radical SAM superfamily)
MIDAIHQKEHLLVPCVFGPVPSRRLGLSLGVDLIPPKTCSFDCIYCQVGRTTRKILTPELFVPVQKVMDEIKKKLDETTPDTITLAGSGEPTLYLRLDQLIARIKKTTRTKVAILTNGSLFMEKEIRRRVLDADLILPTLTTSFDNTFRKIHHPHPDLNLAMVVEGLRKLRKDYTGQLYLEVVLISGVNDTDEEIHGLKKAMDGISPDKIQLNTVVRPPADPTAKPLDMKRLKEIMGLLGEKAEIVAEPRHATGSIDKNSMIVNLLEMIKRRPLTPEDIKNTLGVSLTETEALIKDLLIREKIREQKHLGKTYYLRNDTLSTS